MGRLSYLYAINQMDDNIHEIVINDSDNRTTEDILADNGLDFESYACVYSEEKKNIQNSELKYLYVFEYGSGSILEIVLDYNDEREIEDILEANGLKESMCNTMVSTTMLRIEQVNKD